MLATALPVLLLLVGPAAARDGDAERGQALFRRQCDTYHQVAQPRNGVGPTLQNVVGRVADEQQRRDVIEYLVAQ